MPLTARCRDPAGLETGTEGVRRNGLASPLGTGVPTTTPSPGAPGLVIIPLAERISRVPRIAGDVLDVVDGLRHGWPNQRGRKDHGSAKKSKFHYAFLL
jgi:hypothetical protein